MVKLTSAILNQLRKTRDISPISSTIITSPQAGEFIIFGEVEIDSFELERGISDNTWITFNGVTFLGKVSLDDLVQHDKYTFINCNFLGETLLRECGNAVHLKDRSYFKNKTTLILSSSHSEKLELCNIDFEGVLLITSSKSILQLLVDNMNRNQCKGKGTLIMRNEFSKVILQRLFVDYLLVGNDKEKGRHNVQLHGEVDISDVEIVTCKINQALIGNVLRIAKAKIDQLEISNLSAESNRIEIKNSSTINQCSIHLGTLKTIQILGDIEFRELNLQGVIKKEQELSIEDSQVTKKFNLLQVENKGTVTFNRLKITLNSILSIVDSNMGVTKFINCTIAESRWEFQNSQISEIFIVNTHFPKTIFLPDKKDPDHSQEQLAFGQLHTACKKQGDTIGELNYQSQELQAHYELLQWNRQTFLKKINLWLNKWSNNFGRFWGRGILFTIIIGIVGFYLVVISSNEYSIGSHMYCDRFASSFFKFMNPIRFFDLDSLFESNGANHLTLHFGSYLIDFLARVFLAYGYYQTIQAFRRFGRN